MPNPNPQVRIVLVRPRNPLNLLSAARAAANFGFDDVRVISPYEPTWNEAQAAPEAGKWMRKTRRVESLSEALADRNWALGTSCLVRRNVDAADRILPLDEVRQRAKKSKGRDRIAILFGSEKRGLSNQELEMCHAVIRIPTSPEVPSMNLGQAVAVCCYELRRWARPAITARSKKSSLDAALASVEEITRLVQQLGDVLVPSGVTAGRERRRQLRLRQMIMRLPLTAEEVRLALGVLRDLSWRLRANQ